ncbi:hypothetical protein [Paraburkholderia sp. RL17-337-BIB-A]|uniref:hypothetical protein n=1 Tax=Paraburkholderia sp. RL17-337-BIB-A TaxID=3031636 RepID=UPI0038B841E0
MTYKNVVFNSTRASTFIRDSESPCGSRSASAASDGPLLGAHPRYAFVACDAGAAECFHNDEKRVLNGVAHSRSSPKKLARGEVSGQWVKAAVLKTVKQIIDFTVNGAKGEPHGSRISGADRHGYRA